MYLKVSPFFAADKIKRPILEGSELELCSVRRCLELFVGEGRVRTFTTFFGELSRVPLPRA